MSAGTVGVLMLRIIANLLSTSADRLKPWYDGHVLRKVENDGMNNWIVK